MNSEAKDICYLKIFKKISNRSSRNEALAPKPSNFYIYSLFSKWTKIFGTSLIFVKN